MAWLTVGEAAEWLDISEEAVRKRIQRDTLKHGKSLNGRVYVHLVNEQDGDEDEPPFRTPDKDSNANDQRSWWDYAAGASGLAVLFGGLIYALGLFALWAPIARTHTHDLTTALHTTFLVPRGIVAGLGVEQLVAFPLLAGVLMLTWLVVVRRRLLGKFDNQGLLGLLVYAPLALAVAIYCTWRLAVGPGPLAQAPHFALGILVIESFGVLSFLYYMVSHLREGRYKNAALSAVQILFYGFVAYAMWRWLITPSVEPMQTLRGTVWALIDTSIVAGAASLVYIGAAVGASNTLESSSQKGMSRADLLRALILVTGFAFLGAFLLTPTTFPPLPKVTIDVKNKDKNATGTLLTHTESFWYVFEEHQGQPGSRLTAIPDEQVKTASISKDT